MAIAWSRISSKVIAYLPLPMQRTEDGVDIAQIMRCRYTAESNHCHNSNQYAATDSFAHPNPNAITNKNANATMDSNQNTNPDTNNCTLAHSHTFAN
jgi:hypothetical protein